MVATIPVLQRAMLAGPRTCELTERTQRSQRLARFRRSADLSGLSQTTVLSSLGDGSRGRLPLWLRGIAELEQQKQLTVGERTDCRARGETLRTLRTSRTWREIRGASKAAKLPQVRRRTPNPAPAKQRRCRRRENERTTEDEQMSPVVQSLWLSLPANQLPRDSRVSASRMDPRSDRARYPAAATAACA